MARRRQPPLFELLGHDYVDRMRAGVPSGVEPKPVSPEKPDRSVVVHAEEPEEAPPEREARRDDAARETRAAWVGVSTPLPSPVAVPDTAPRNEPAAVPDTGMTPASAGRSAAASRHAEELAGRAAASPEPAAGRHFTITMNQVYVGLAVLITLGVIGWTLAWNLGGSTREKELLSGPQLPEVSGGNAAIRDPLAQADGPVGSSPAVAAGRDSGTADRGTSGGTGLALPGQDSRPAAGPAPAGGLYLVSGGSRGTDPRQERTNYLRLATGVSAADARAAVDYLKGQGVEALAAPQLDSRGVPKNNPPRYDLFGLFGIPSDRYSAMADERERYTLRLIEAGESWRASGGAMKFIEPSWERFRP